MSGVVSGLIGLRVLDAHMHLDDLPEQGVRITAADCVARMDEAGVDAAVVMTFVEAPQGGGDPLSRIAAACAQYPGRLIGFVRLHPAYGDEARRLLEHAVTQLGFRGLKLHPVGSLVHPAEPSSVALVREAARLGVPVLFHCGDEALCTPYQIAALARACPEATVILGHMGGYHHVDDAIAVGEELPNVVLETSAMPYPEKIAEAVSRVGAERVIFGSDGPMCSPRLEIEKVRLAGLRPGDARRVLGENVAELLGLTR